MTLLQAYLLFGIPAIALSMAWGASWLVKSDYRKLEARERSGR